MTKILLFLPLIYLHYTAITCPSLPSPTNGGISFTTVGPSTYGTLAIYFCDRGYGISGGDMTVMCGGDGSSPVGEWSGSAPNCSGA